MSEPSVEANLGSVECNSYKAGHNVHWIPVLKEWTNEPRIPMTIRHITSNAFEITCDGKSQIVYNHNPSAVIKAIHDAKLHWFKKVGNTGAITIESNRGHVWLYFSDEPFIDCEQPQPRYYDKFRFIDKEIEKAEHQAKTNPDINKQVGAKVLELKLKHIKKLQLENAHKTMSTFSGYELVCSCSLLLDFKRKIDVGVGHVNY
ncbi:MAG: hypothetical protein RLZZ380_1134 [Actinomycetota bacterium]|jgi:hypothetical protein